MDSVVSNTQGTAGRWTRWLIGALLLGFLFAAAWLSNRFANNLEQAAQTQQRSQIRESAEAYRANANAVLGSLQASLQSMASYLASTNTVDAVAIAGMSQSVLQRHPSVRAVFIVNQWSHAEREAQGVLKIQERNWLGAFQDAALAEQYYVIQESFVQPGLPDEVKARLDAFRGLNVAPELDVQPMLNAQSLINISYRGFSSGGSLVGLPIVQAQALRGLLLVELDFASLLASTGETRLQNNSGSRLFDTTDPSGQKLVFPSARSALDPVASEVKLRERRADTQVSRFEALGRQFAVETEPLASFYEQAGAGVYSLIRYGGIAVSALGALLLLNLLTRNARIERLVQQRGDELKTAYEQIRDSELMSMQSEKMSSLGQMVAGVAHEINTPLAFATSNVELLRDRLGTVVSTVQQQSELMAQLPNWKTLDQAARNRWYQQALAQSESLERTRQRALSKSGVLIDESMEGLNRVRDLVATLKDFSRVDRAPVDQVNVHQCIENTLKIAHNVVKHKAEVALEFGELPPVRCNPSQINQVLLNLISNAAQAIPEFGQIVIRTHCPDSKQVQIDISDNGVGMDAKTQQRIFEAFFTTKGSGEGTGLGLAICDKIVRNHGGYIRVRSELGKGTCFSVYLPISGALDSTTTEGT
jgi:signal transduction histidine kinase